MEVYNSTTSHTSMISLMSRNLGSLGMSDLKLSFFNIRINLEEKTSKDSLTQFVMAMGGFS